MRARGTRQQLARIREGFRVSGYNDGRAGKPARYTLAEYQTAYRRGREAREAAERLDHEPFYHDRKQVAAMLRATKPVKEA